MTLKGRTVSLKNLETYEYPQGNIEARTSMYDGRLKINKWSYELMDLQGTAL